MACVTVSTQSSYSPFGNCAHSRITGRTQSRSMCHTQPCSKEISAACARDFLLRSGFTGVAKAEAAFLQKPFTHLELLEVGLDDLKRAAGVAGGTVNDGYLAAIAGGFRRYHERHGMPVDELRVTLPISRSAA